MQLPHVSTLRTRLADTLDRTGAIDAALRLRRHLSLPFLTVLTYHRVSDLVPGEFDADVVDATPSELDEHLRLLGSAFTPVGIDDVTAHFERGAPLPRNPALVTFDDGYRDGLSNAVPILRARGVRAVFFVSTQYVTNRRLFWWDKITYLVRRSTRESISLRVPRPITLRLDDRGAATQALLRIVKDTFGLDVDAFLDDLAEATGVHLAPEREREIVDEMLLTWDEVRALRDAGMDVGSHTRTHRILQTLRPDDLRRELLGSRVELEAHLERPVRSISYPVGGSVNRDPAIRAEIASAGYSVGFSSGTGVQLLGRRASALDVRRVAVDRTASRSYLRASIALPFFAHQRPRRTTVRD